MLEKKNTNIIGSWIHTNSSQIQLRPRVEWAFTVSAWVSEQCERVCCAQGEEPSKKYWGMHCGDAQSAYLENVTAFTWTT